MNKLFYLCCLSVVFFSSCSLDPCLTKGLFISGYEKFNDEVSSNHKAYSDNDWESRDLKMDKYIGECYKRFEPDLTKEEKKNFWIQYFKYKYYHHGRRMLRAIEDDANEFSLELDKEFEDLFDNPEKDIKKILNDLYGDDIDKAIDDFVNGIKSIGDKIKELLDQE